MNKLIDKVINDTGNSIDIIYKEIMINNKVLNLIYSEILCDSDDINNYLLNNITFINIITKRIDNIDNIIPAANIKIINKDTIIEYLYKGFCIVIYQNNIMAIEFRLGLNRGINEPTNEPSLKGPKDAFNEHLNTNLGLIRKRIKSKYLYIKEKLLGELTKTKVAICYMNNIYETKTLDLINNKLDSINIDGIIDSNYIKNYFEQESKFFPIIQITERPDLVAMALLEGKIILVVENTPYVLIMPIFFVDFFHTTDDYYQRNINTSFLRIIRLLGFIIAIFTPGLYIAITTHNQDAIPLSLLTNFAIQRESVPFPAIVEAGLLIISFEILRESDIRMPSNMGTAISILGGLVLGDAAVTAGIVSPIMIIVIAITIISGIMFSSVELNNSIRWWRYIVIFLGAFLGIYGLFLGGILLIYNLASIKSLGKPYLAPLAPLIINDALDSFIKIKTKDRKRNPLLTKNKYRGK